MSLYWIMYLEVNFFQGLAQGYVHRGSASQALSSSWELRGGERENCLLHIQR